MPPILSLASWALCVLVLFSPLTAGAETVQLQDVAGRTVSVEVPVKSIALGEGRHLPALAILNPENPAQYVAGMMGDFEKYDPATYDQYKKHFPVIEEIPRIGANGAHSFSVENTFSVAPDVAVFSLSSGHGPSETNATILAQLEAANIPVVFIDFRQNPLVNTPKSIELLGKLLGREQQADAFIQFYTEQLTRVQSKLSHISERPSVFLEGHVGLRPQCCSGFGDGMMGHFINGAGGKNAYADLIPGAFGMVNVEHLITHQPDVYIGTAIGSALTAKERPNLIALGAGTKADLAASSLSKASTRDGIAQLAAVQEGRAHALWHNFYNSPMNVVAVQVIAKWLHPELFTELEPEKTLQTYFERFQPYPVDGVYWASLTTKDY